MPQFGKPGERIGYRVYRHPRQGPPLILIHGFTASSAAFAANIDALNDHYTVVTVDLLGHGESESPADTALYGPGPTVERIVELIDHLGFETVMVCGHALGAAVALRMALDVPERVSGLIMINSMTAVGTPEWRNSARPGMDELAARIRADGVTFLRHTRLYPAHSKRLDARSREMLVQAFDQATANGLAGTAESLVVDANCFERLNELTTPTLLIVGDQEVTFARMVPDFVARVPGGRVRQVHLPEAGHAANLEQPTQFEAAVINFGRDLRYLPLRSGTAATGGMVDTSGGQRRGISTMGAIFITGGLMLLAGAFMVMQSRDNKETTPPPAPVPSESPATGPGAAIPEGATAVTNVATVMSAQPTSAATARPAATSAPPTIPADRSPAAAARKVSITGPDTVAVNEKATFAAIVTSDTAYAIQWLANNDAVIANWNAPNTVITFPSAACVTVSLTVRWGSTDTGVTSKNVSVGGVAC